MAPPTITGFFPLLTKANFAASAIFTNVTPPTLSVVGEQLRAEANAGAGAPYSYVELPVEGGPLDLSAAVLECLVNQDWGAGRGFSIGLSSGASPNTNWKVWRCPGALTNRRVQYFIDPSSTDFYLSGGIFDPSDVRRFRYQWDGNQTERNIIFTDEPIWIPKVPGLVAAGGDVANPITAETFGNFLSLLAASGGYHSNTIEVTSRQGFGNYQALPVGCSIGDGITPQVTSFDSAVFRTPDTTDVSGGTSQPTVAISNTNRRVNTSSAESFSAFQVIGLSAGDGFQDVSPVNNDYSNFFARNLGVISLGQGDYQGRISQPLGSVNGGRNVALNFNGSTAQYTYVWNGTANLSGSVFDSPLSDYAIDITDFTDGATFDASDIRFLQNPAVNKFRLNAPGKTLNIAVGVSGITVVDVDIVAGTLVIVEPTPIISIIGFPSGSTVSVAQGGITLDLLNSATSPYQYQTQSGEGDVYTFKVIAQGFVDFLIDINKTVSTSVTYVSVPEGSQQTVNKAYLDFVELMAKDAAFTRIAGTDDTLHTQLWEKPEWETEWNSAVVADTPSTAEINGWAGYLTTSDYARISFNSVTGEVI